jgi:putative RecB family exonuclease
MADTAIDNQPEPPAAGGGGAPRRRPALSPSRAADFKQCPLLYRFRTVDRLPETPTVAQVRGTVVHAVLEELFTLPAEQRLPERAMEMLAPAWAGQRAERPELAEAFTERDAEEILDSARTLVRSYFAMEDPRRLAPEACETLVEAELDSGVLLRGYVDRLDVAPTGEIRVVDYKTGSAPREAFENKALFQMKFYALVLYRMRGVVPRQLRLMYLAGEQSLAYEPDEAELLRFERTLEAIWKAILAAGRTGDFRASPGKLCRWCDHKARCPEFGGTPPPYPGWPDPDAAVETAADKAE